MVACISYIVFSRISCSLVYRVLSYIVFSLLFSSLLFSSLLFSSLLVPSLHSPTGSIIEGALSHELQSLRPYPGGQNPGGLPFGGVADAGHHAGAGSVWQVPHIEKVMLVCGTV